MRQIVTTCEQLDALPRLAVIAQFFAADEHHPPGILVYVRRDDGWEGASDEPPYASEILLPPRRQRPPFTVLYRPDQDFLAHAWDEGFAKGVVDQTRWQDTGIPEGGVRNPYWEG